MDKLRDLTADDLILLERGLTALEAAIQATEQPVPDRLGRLRKVLKRSPIGEETREWPESHVMRTPEVVETLEISPQHVHQLGRKGVLEVVQAGHRGRNGSALYTTMSVRNYAEHRPAPGRKRGSK